MSEEITNPNGEGQEQSNAGEQENKGISFPDEATFMARLSRESNKTKKAFLKDLGFESEDDLKALVQAKREADEASKTELERLTEQLTNVTRERDEYVSKANAVLKQTEAKLMAQSLGVKPERLDYLLKLANIDSIEVQDGKVDSEALKSAFENVLNDIPELRVSGTSKAGGDFSQGGQDTLLTMEAIKNMTPEQYAARRPEIMDFLSKHK